MKPILALLASPRPAGTSEQVAALFAEGARESGCPVSLVALRDYRLAPCRSCGACAAPPFRCALSRDGDQTEEIFLRLRAAPLILLCSPIHFYALPASFQGFIERSQRFWQALQKIDGPPPSTRPTPVLAALVAGRRRGRQLFSGALLTLRYFLALHAAAIVEKRLLRGMECPADLLARPALCRTLRAWGRKWGTALQQAESAENSPERSPKPPCRSNA